MKKVALVVDNSGSLTKEEMEKINVSKLIPISFIVISPLIAAAHIKNAA